MFSPDAWTGCIEGSGRLGRGGARGESSPEDGPLPDSRVGCRLRAAAWADSLFLILL